MKTDLSNIQSKEMIPGFKGKFVHMEQFTIANWEVEKGAVLPEHAHVNEQTSQVMEGEFEMTIGGKTTVFKPGMIAMVHANVVHSGRALTPCTIVDVFSPARPEYNND